MKGKNPNSAGRLLGKSQVPHFSVTEEARKVGVSKEGLVSLRLAEVDTVLGLTPNNPIDSASL